MKIQKRKEYPLPEVEEYTTDKTIIEFRFKALSEVTKFCEEHMSDYHKREEFGPRDLFKEIFMYDLAKKIKYDKTGQILPEYKERIISNYGGESE